MLGGVFGIPCTERCELVLALTNLLARERLVETAYALANDANRSAITLARKLADLPEAEAREISILTLARAGVTVTPERG